LLRRTAYYLGDKMQKNETVGGGGGGWGGWGGEGGGGGGVGGGGGCGAYGVEERCREGFSGRTLGGKTTDRPSIR